MAKYCSILRSSIPILENTLHFQDGMNKRFDDMRLAGGLPPYAGEAPWSYDHYVPYAGHAGPSSAASDQVPSTLKT